MRYLHIDSSDVNEHAALLPQWDQFYEQVSSGRFGGRLEDLSLGSVEVFRETTGPAVVQRGSARRGTLTLGVALPGCAEAWFLGRSVRPGQSLSVVSGREFDLATRGRFDVAAVSVDLADLDAYSQRVEGEPLAWPPMSHAVFDDAAGDAALAELVLTVLATARDQPQRLDQAALQRSLRQALCDLLLARWPGRRPAAGDVTAATRQRVVRAARQYMAEHAEAAITVPELCEAIHVSRRTLQYAFQEVLGMSPVTYLRALRLNGVRRHLQRGGDEPIADRAARWGFWHLSRFAADYRVLFGELPSDTLRAARDGRNVH